MRCPKCGGYSFNNDDQCMNCKCGYVIPPPKRPLGWESKDYKASSSSYGINGKSAELVDCPNCQEKALFWNKYYQLYECLSCKRVFLSNMGVEGNPLDVYCPHCESPDIFYNRTPRSWKCHQCGRNFLNPKCNQSNL